MADKKEVEEIEKIKAEEDMLKQGNVSLILESYNDIFSDFDPRSYSERALSDDFLEECRRAVRDKKEEFKLELRLLIPKSKRNLIDEIGIKKRLKNHFQKHFEEKQREVRKIRKEGVVWLIFGVALIFSSTFLYTQKGFLFILLFILFEPAGWFTIWNGLEQIFFKTKEKKPELDFYRKMSKLQIIFNSY